jgi:hypothetical protein
MPVLGNISKKSMSYQTELITRYSKDAEVFKLGL